MSSRVSRTTPAPRRPTCCASTWRFRRHRRRTSTASSAATSPGSRTDVACSMTWPPSRFVPSPGATIPLVDPELTPPDGAAGAVSDFSAAQFSSGVGARQQPVHRPLPVPGLAAQRIRHPEMTESESAGQRPERAGGARHRRGDWSAAGDGAGSAPRHRDRRSARSAGPMPAPIPACTSADRRAVPAGRAVSHRSSAGTWTLWG